MRQGCQRKKTTFLNIHNIIVILREIPAPACIDYHKHTQRSILIYGVI